MYRFKKKKIHKIKFKNIVYFLCNEAYFQF